jgi:hypothetical protein
MTGIRKSFRARSPVSGQLPVCRPFSRDQPLLATSSSHFLASARACRENRIGRAADLRPRPKLEADFSDVSGWLKANPGKWVVLSGRLSCHGHYALDALPVNTRQVLPHNRVVDYRCHLRNALGRSLQT